MVGCLDAVTHTGEAVREMAGGLAAGDAALMAQRARFPQPFGPDGRMMPRTAETACGALLLARFPLWKVSVRVLRNAFCAQQSPHKILAGSFGEGVKYVPSDPLCCELSTCACEAPQDLPRVRRDSEVGGCTLMWRVIPVFRAERSAYPMRVP